VFTQGGDVQPDGLGDQVLDLFTVFTDGDASSKVRHVSTPSFSLLLDDYDVLSHAVPFAICQPAAKSRPAYPSAPRR
jgi:hypothetical protein